MMYEAPPAPRGRGAGSGKAGGGYAADGRTATALGDAVERALVEQLGFEAAQSGRQGPFDVRSGERVYEVKACSVEATEYKVKPRKADVAAKLEAARLDGSTPCVVIAVVDGDEAWVYTREGLGAFRLTSSWTFLGRVTV